MDSREKAANAFDFTDARWQRAVLLGIHQERGQVTPQRVLQTPHQTAAGSQKHLYPVFGSDALNIVTCTRQPHLLQGLKELLKVWCVPVSAVHQVGQIQLTLPRQRAQLGIVLEEVEQFGGVGHPKGQGAGDGPLALRGKSRSRVRTNRSTLTDSRWIFWSLAWMTSRIMATILLVIRVTRCDGPLTWAPRLWCCCRANRPAA